MRQSFFRACVRPAAIALAAIAASIVSTAPLRAADRLQFILSGEDGYGISDCMKAGQECGRVMADAWCEAHGHSRSDMFGLADDITGSTDISKAAATTAPPPGAVIIHCGE